MEKSRDYESKKISVIITAYNNGNFIEQCVKSVYQNFVEIHEIIVINDGSEDNTKFILEKLEEEIPIMKAFSLSHQGAVVARKEGIKRANGDWIIFVDGDDYVEVDYFGKNNWKQIDRNADVVIMKSYYKIFPNGIKEIITDNIKTGNYSGTDLKYIKEKLNDISPSLCLKLFKREFVECYLNSPPEDIRVSNDMVVSYPAIYNASNVQVIDSCFYCYRVMFYKKSIERTDKIISFLKTYSIVSECIKIEEVSCKFRVKILSNIIPLCNAYDFTKISLYNLREIGKSKLFLAFFKDISCQTMRESGYFLEIFFLKHRLFFSLLLINKLKKNWNKLVNKIKGRF